MQGLSGGDPGGCHHIFHQVPVGAVSRHHNDDDADDDNGDGGGIYTIDDYDCHLP